MTCAKISGIGIGFRLASRAICHQTSFGPCLRRFLFTTDLFRPWLSYMNASRTIGSIGKPKSDRSWVLSKVRADADWRLRHPSPMVMVHGCSSRLRDGRDGPSKSIGATPSLRDGPSRSFGAILIGTVEKTTTSRRTESVPPFEFCESIFCTTSNIWSTMPKSPWCRKSMMNAG